MTPAGPFAPDAEVAVLGTMLQDALAITLARDAGLVPGDFSEPRAQICLAIYAEIEAGRAVDPVTITEHLRRAHLLNQLQPDDYPERLAQRGDSVPHVETYIADVRDAAIKRATLFRLAQTAQSCQNGVPPGNIAKELADIAAQIEQRTPQNTRQRFQLLTAPQFLTRPKPQFLVDDLIVTGSQSCLLGPPATYKSFLALSIAAAVSTGTNWHGRRVQQGPVAYISGEGSAGLSARIRALEIARNTPFPDSCYFLPEAVQLWQAGEVHAFIAALKQLPEPPKLIVVDTLARALVGGDENSAKEMGLLIAGCDRLRAEFDAHILIIHHFNKAGGSRGSSALDGAIDTKIEVKREGNLLTVSCGKQKDFDEFQSFCLVKRVVELDNEGSTSLVFDLDHEVRPADVEPEAWHPKSRAHVEARNQTLEVLRRAGKSLRAGEWQRLCESEGIARRSFYNYRDDLVRDGQVSCAAGLYIPAHQG